ncbi:MAG: Galactosyltransferase [Candidatus Daviesbacteria bacterium GW2011_GWB1_41_5]|uniref:Galactosyltransferase n=1 Tax=Candidatus Daviesbacteria bacterium GW2011_GWB1_41_5 TaxID=1618429 RepID=A0A0G0YS58_9BACT|nr:MAG: Galactosyltransferase [Candidatus Daviesbacteria bacterium GW2011_GWB1_41_5]
MAKLLMITGLGSARDLAQGRQGAFYQTLEEFHRYWERIDIIVPRCQPAVTELFGNVFLHVSPWPLWLHLWWFIQMGKKIFKEQHFDLMTVQEFPPFYNGIAARWLGKLTRVPYVLELHHLPGFPRASSGKEIFYRLLTRWFLAYDAKPAKAVRVVNQTEVGALLRKFGLPANKIAYIPSLYIDTELFRPLSLTKAYDLVWSGRMEKNKNLVNLLKAVAIAKHHNPQLRLLLIGQGGEKNKLAVLAQRLGLTDNIEFAGWLKTPGELVEKLNQAKIFINCSYNEGGPRNAVEALACGLALVTTPVGSMPDIITDGVSGKFSGWSAPEIAAAIGQLLANKKQQAKFAAAGPGLVQRFEKKAMIRNYATWLQSQI